MSLPIYERGMDGLRTIANAEDSGWKNAEEILWICGRTAAQVEDVWFEIGEYTFADDALDEDKETLKTGRYKEKLIKTAVIHKNRIIVDEQKYKYSVLDSGKRAYPLGY